MSSSLNLKLQPAMFTIETYALAMGVIKNNSLVALDNNSFYTRVHTVCVHLLALQNVVCSHNVVMGINKH